MAAGERSSQNIMGLAQGASKRKKLIEERKSLRDKIGQFTAIPHEFIKRGRTLSVHSKWLFVVLRFYTNSHSDRVFPSYAELQSTSGLRREMISKGIKELEEAGWLKRQKRFSRSTVYTLTLPRKARKSKTAKQPAGDEVFEPLLEFEHYHELDEAEADESVVHAEARQRGHGSSSSENRTDDNPEFRTDISTESRTLTRFIELDL
jgi:DNA-binding HxlR family transcriptional regulator